MNIITSSTPEIGSRNWLIGRNQLHVPTWPTRTASYADQTPPANLPPSQQHLHSNGGGRPVGRSVDWSLMRSVASTPFQCGATTLTRVNPAHTPSISRGFALRWRMMNSRWIRRRHHQSRRVWPTNDLKFRQISDTTPSL